ncbi:MAG: hypothetical protein H0W72_16880 [Planctomycetes bacterium]|nr:hypothetical protein [Planctomycetota bacterium]
MSNLPLMLWLCLALCAPRAAAESAAIVALRNVLSIDGQGVDPNLAPVVVTYGDRCFAIGASSRETAEAIRKMRPEAALRAIVAYDRRLTDVIGLPARR